MSMDLGSFGRYEADFSSPTLFKRCVQCPAQPPPCPACKSDETCALVSGGCDNCPRTQCTAIGSSSSSSSSSSGNPSGGSAAGPIAGGVIGGLLFVCLLTFLLWRFCIRSRVAARRNNVQPYDDWPETATVYEKDVDGFTMQRDARASVHSVRSIASTVYTRASNVIQIAYIPGVTNRSVESTPDLIPPVPPIPALSPAHSAATTPATTQDDQHFFMPSDLRDSTYSDYNVESQYGRSSFARGSMQSTAYRGSAVVNTLPAQTAIRGKANPVKVKSNARNSPAETPRSATPPIPIMDRTRVPTRGQGPKDESATSPIVARSGVPKAVTVTRAPSSSNLQAAAVKPSPLTITKVNRQGSVASSRHNGDSSTFDDPSSSDEESPADQSLMGHDKLPQFIKSSYKAGTGPFRSPSAPDFHQKSSMGGDSIARTLGSKERKQKHKRSGSLNQIIEEAARRASREPRHGGLGSGSVDSIGADYRRQLKEGPFSDANAARTP